MFKSVRSLKTELSDCLHRVQRGEECWITSHQRLIAKIVPVQSPTTIEDLKRQTFLIELKKNLIQPKKTQIPLSKQLIQKREDERY